MTPEFRAGERDVNPKTDANGVSFDCIECGEDSDAYASVSGSATMAAYYVCKSCCDADQAGPAERSDYDVDEARDAAEQHEADMAEPES